MKVRLALEEFGVLPRRCAVPLRVIHNPRASVRANCRNLESFPAETFRSFHSRTCAPPLDFHEG
jgi:hypothetical protein